MEINDIIDENTLIEIKNFTLKDDDINKLLENITLNDNILNISDISDIDEEIYISDIDEKIEEDIKME